MPVRLLPGREAHRLAGHSPPSAHLGYHTEIVEGADGPVDCLLWRDSNGYIRGIHYHYPVDFPPFERAGNVNMWVAPGWQGAGIGTTLLAAADRRWLINFAQQSYTTGGLAFVQRYLMRGQRLVEQ